MAKNTYFKILSKFSILVMILAILPVTNLSAETNTYGNHTQFLAPVPAPAPEDIKIYTAGDLNNVRYNLNGSYVLMNDIDLATWGEWKPIGDYSNPFVGDFNGQGHVIKNLTITDGTYQYVGLFGYSNDGTIKNVGLEDTNISVFSISRTCIVGGICGQGSGMISKCYNTGIIYVSSLIADSSDTEYFAGGICGSFRSGSVLNCYNLGDIYVIAENLLSSIYAGGICGINSGNISNCYAAGDISTVTGSGYFRPCYSYVGGICGQGGNILNCIVLSNQIRTEGSDVLGDIYCSLISNEAIKTNNLARMGISGGPVDDSNGFITSTEAKKQTTYEDILRWSFENDWEIMENDGYPYLKPYSPEIDEKYTVSFKAGEHGTMTPTSASEEVAEGNTVKAVPDIAPKTGYVFIGWKSNFGGIYDGEAVLLYPITRDITFTAVYADSANATVIFDYNGGRAIEMEYGKELDPDKDIVSGREVDSDYVSGRPGTAYIPPDPVKSGYVHSGWLRVYPGGWLPERPSGFYGAEKTITKYVAQWAAKINTVTFSAGVNGAMAPDKHNESVYYGESVKIVPEIEAKSGYVFIGWESSLGGVCDSEMVKSYPVTGDITFTARYVAAAKATVIFDYNGGRVEEDLPNYFSGEPGTPYRVLEPGKTGHTFAGWLPSEPTKILAEAGSTIVYTAQWKQNAYIVTFVTDANGIMTIDGDESPLETYSVEVFWGESVRIVPFIDPATGYTFHEWSKNGGSTYYSGEDISEEKITEDTTFVAQYRKIIVPGSSGGGGERPASATLTVKGIDKATDAIIYNQSVTAFVGDGEVVSAPIIKGYALDKDSPTSQTVTIKSGSNTVNFYYNYLSEEPVAANQTGRQIRFTVSEKIMSTLETEDHIKYIGGYPNGSVQPDGKITRAEVAIIFWRLLKTSSKNDDTKNRFNDIKGNEGHAQAVNYLAAAGIIQGYEDGNFRPFAAISRVEFAAIASRFDDLSTASANPFTDVPEDYWAFGYIVSAYQKGWINGYPGGEFRPQSSISRAEAVKIVNCMLGRGIKLADLPESLPSYTDLTRTHWAYCEIMEASVSHECDRDTDGWEIWRSRE
ncbi:MAG: S-layer homology domain-containing protein [Clostridiales bacterium]|nr:S-layer homology domain-containing protein [Clostridiales bacterium]